MSDRLRSFALALLCASILILLAGLAYSLWQKYDGAYSRRMPLRNLDACDRIRAELPWSCLSHDADLQPQDGKSRHVLSDFLSVDGWVLCADFYLDGEHVRPMPQITHGQFPVLFVETQRVDELTEILLRLRTPYVLLTADHLDTLSGCPRDTYDTVHPLLMSDVLVSWWGTYPGIVHPKFHPLPLGPKWEFHHTDFFAEDTSAQYELLSRALLQTPQRIRKSLLHAKFDVHTTNNPVVAAHRGERHRAAEAVERMATAGHAEAIDAVPVPPSEFLQDLATSHFSLCPPGNGPDTHRLWEALYMSTIPIVLRYAPLSPILDDLPVVQVDTWDDLSEAYLRAKQEEMEKAMRHWNRQELTRSYWSFRIRAQGSRAEVA